MKLLLLFIATITYSLAYTQQDNTTRVTPRELAIPPSPVFDLMGVTPSQINRTADIKDFKVDWSFKSWRLNPNLAIQSQPIWEILYNRKDLEKYQQASPFMRKLASLDISIGSVQNEEADRRMGFAAKMNLLRQKDPLMARELYNGLTEKYRTEKTELEKQLAAATIQLDTAVNVLEKPTIRNTVKSLQEQLLTLNSRRNGEINALAKVFVAENWNASSLDVAVGKIYTFKTDSVGSLTSLRLNRNTGWGGWLNGSVGIGKKILISGLFRTTWYEEELKFLVKNTATQEDEQQTAVASNTLYTMGINLRYGGPLYTFFVEMLYEQKSLKTPVEALQEVFTEGANKKLITSTVNWDVVHPNTLSLGGDWRISQSVIINYGMRCVFDKSWRFTTFTPVVSIACMMR